MKIKVFKTTCSFLFLEGIKTLKQLKVDISSIVINYIVDLTFLNSHTPRMSVLDITHMGA